MVCFARDRQRKHISYSVIHCAINSLKISRYFTIKLCVIDIKMLVNNIKITVLISSSLCYLFSYSCLIQADRPRAERCLQSRPSCYTSRRETIHFDQLAQWLNPGIVLLRVPQAMCTTARSIRNSIETKAENNRLEAKQYPAIQRNLTENTIDQCGTRSKPHFVF
jgi:hypothetical protein